MNIKDSVLESLERNRGGYISGEQLAADVGVSRQAVCKAVKKLKDEGHIITASTKKGYRLESTSDVISASVISAMTGAKAFAFDCVDSTNKVAAELFLKSGECIVCALCQTGGRKKDGGNFYSPKDKGIYLSYAIPLDIPLDKLNDLRILCGQTVADVLTAACGKTAARQNIDDVFIDGKKVCGILTECTVNCATERTESAVIGIGIYTGEQCFADTTLSSVMPDESRNFIIASICLELKKRLERVE